MHRGQVESSRHSWGRRPAHLLAVGAIAAALAGCGGSDDSQSGTSATSDAGKASCENTSVTIATNADANNINPILAVDLDGRFRTDLLFDPLVEVHPKTMKAVPRLARSWDLSKDGLTYTFELAPEARFQDGEPLTADDVAFTVMSILDPEYQGPLQADWARLEGADRVIAGKADNLPGLKVVDDHTIRMTLSEPYAGFLTQMARQLKPLPEHLLKGEGPLTISSEFSKRPVGSGPYKLVRWLEGSKFEVEAWPDYWGGEPCMKRITQTIIPDTNTLTAALQSGQVDASIIPPPSALPSLESNPTLRVHQMPPLTAEGLEFNMKAEPWKSKPKLRQAIAHGIDYASFAREAMGQETPRPAQYFSWASWAYNPDAEIAAYDPARAKQLLTEAGYPGGEGLELTISTNTDNEFRAQETTFVQAELAKLGINVKLTKAVWGTFIASVTEHTYDVAAMNNGDNAGIPDPTALDPVLTCDGGSNFSGYCNPRVDELIAKGSATTDRAERKRYYGEVQEILAEDLPFLPGFWRPNTLVVKTSMKNVQPSVIGAYWNIQDWSNQ